ncbi:hypothetical protein RRG08_004657 [Elysia crispata]|uniref:Uncharacterized protein n=1 Tax=Elysia crispata TaxID=231223 RepID=A0AAE1DJA6_9GAST|nr:hypothetical protein RRG08_004657 [Elysia crispata]
MRVFVCVCNLTEGALTLLYTNTLYPNQTLAHPALGRPQSGHAEELCQSSQTSQVTARPVANQMPDILGKVQRRAETANQEAPMAISHGRENRP